MRILAYVRPWTKAQFLELARVAFPGSELNYIGDFKGIGGLDLQELFYSYLESSPYFSLLSPNELEDIRLRCRLLRTLDVYTAEKHIMAMYQALDEIFSSWRPEVVFGNCLDSYTSDLLRLVCNKHGLRYLGIVPTVANGYYRLTERGEYQAIREPDEHEIIDVYNKLVVRAETPQFITPITGRLSLYRRHAREVARHFGRMIYYQAKRLLLRDPYCYHYWHYVREFSFMNPILPKWIEGDTNWRKHLTKKPEKSVYLPLQFCPEATVDYWVPNRAFINFEDTLYKLLEDMVAHGISVFIKEHPSAVGFRKHSFYTHLAKIEGITVVPIGASTYELMESCAATLVWTGTAGFEASLRGKWVFHLGEPYYAHGPQFIHIASLMGAGDLMSEILGGPPPVTNQQTCHTHIRTLLQNALPGNFTHPARIGINQWKTDHESIHLIAKSLSTVCTNGHARLPTSPCGGEFSL